MSSKSILEQVEAEQSKRYEARLREKAKVQAEAERLTELEAVERDLLNARLDLERLRPAIEEAQAIKRRIEALRGRKREIEKA